MERAGGEVVRTFHKAKPRYLIRSLRFVLGEKRGPVAQWGHAAVSSRVGDGVLKLFLEILLPLAEATGRGEAVRYFIRRAGEQTAWYHAP